VTHLRKLMLEELQRRNYTQSTTRAYLRTIDDSARHFHRPPDQLGPEQIREYVAHLFRDRKLTDNPHHPISHRARGYDAQRQAAPHHSARGGRGGGTHSSTTARPDGRVGGGRLPWAHVGPRGAARALRRRPRPRRVAPSSPRQASGRARGTGGCFSCSSPPARASGRLGVSAAPGSDGAARPRERPSDHGCTSLPRTCGQARATRRPRRARPTPGRVEDAARDLRRRPRGARVSTARRQLGARGRRRGALYPPRADAPVAEGTAAHEAAPDRTTRAATGPRNYRPVAPLFARRRIVSVSSSNCLLCSCSARYFPDKSRVASPKSSPLRS